MNDAITWLLRLDSLGFGQAGVDFDFERPLPMWGWALVLLGACVLGWISYRKLEGPRPGRILLGAFRAMVLALIVVLISGPRLVKPNEVEEPDWVLVLADRSASMGVRDITGDDAARTRISRDEQLKQALDSSRSVWTQLAVDRIVVWLGFDAGAWEMQTGTGTPASADGTIDFAALLGEPAGRRTDLNRALEQALKVAAARPLSGVVLLSDGRSVEEPSRALIRRLEAEKIPVFTVALGNPRGAADLAVRRADGPRSAFVNDVVPVEVEVERIGPPPAPGERAPGAIVELVNDTTGAVLDSMDIAFDQEGGDAEGGAESDARKHKLTLLTRPTVAGNQTWSVRIRPQAGATDALAGIADDLVEDNNRADVPVELVDRPLRVLYFDGYPRWEYRYLKNVLVRESSIACAVTILAPGRRYLQEGTEVLDTLPNSPEEWGKFDVLIIGDVDPRVFTSEQLAQIRDRVATAGLGLIWIAGEGSVPGLWRGTPLADLLPFVAADDAAAEFGSATDAAPAWGEPVTIFPGPGAEPLGLLRLTEKEIDGSWWPARLSDPATGWSQLRWAQRIDPRRLKPTAEVLATARPVLARPSGAFAEAPLVLAMRYGAGRSIYVGTDEIWRWRYGRGEYFTERFWLQIVRLLGRESVARSGKPALLRVLPERTEIERPVRIEVSLLDQALVQARPASLRVRVRRDGASAADDAVELSLSPEGASLDSANRAAPRTFITTWIPVEAGRYRVEAIDPLLVSAGGGSAAAAGLSARVEVWQPDDEMRQPQTDHAVLANLSKVTGGVALSPADLGNLPRLLPNRRLKLAGEPDVQTLWDTPLALILLVVFLTAEWVGRRILRLA